MIINRKNTDGRVKFVEYTGSYPNLCSGVLTLEIDGEIVKFGHNYMKYDPTKNIFKDEPIDKPNYDGFWSSGGCVTHDEHWNWNVAQNEWEIDCEKLPERFWEYASEIDSVFNENVQHGCCGGCI